MGSHESKNEIRDGYEKKKKNEKEENISGNETWRFPTDFTNVRCARIFDRWSGERSESCKQNRSTSDGRSRTVSRVLHTWWWREEKKGKR